MPYQPGDTVTRGLFLMHCNTADTTSDPLPLPSGSPGFQLPDGASWSPQTNPGWTYTSSIFRLAQPTILQGYRVWIPTVSPTHTYTVVRLTGNDPNAMTIRATLDLGLVANLTTGWYEQTVPDVVYLENEYVEVGLISENTSGTTVHMDGDWVSDGTSQNAQPGTGEFNRNNQNTTLRIHQTDDNSTDQSTPLAGIVAGDVIKISGTGVDWQFAVNSNNGVTGGAQNFSVSLVSSTGSISTGTAYNIKVERSGAVTDYVQLPNYWQANTPSWASTANGILLTTAGQSRTLDDNAYGCDILEDEYNIPAAWDVVNVSARILE